MVEIYLVKSFPKNPPTGKCLIVEFVMNFLKRNVSFISRVDTGKYQVVSPGKVSPSHPIPMHIDKPPYFYQYMGPENFNMSKPEIKLNHAVNGVRKSCQIAANILEKCETILKVRLYTSLQLTRY